MYNSSAIQVISLP